MVYYRKYRPQTIHDLDSTLVREKISALLTQAITTKGDIQHAFLFTGPKGLGKTSTARLIAKAVNCERNAFAGKQQEITNKRQEKSEKKQITNEELTTKDSIEPCNECSQCLSIINGSNLDVMEIDAASNRGIDEIRELKEKINLSPAQSRKKVYIIDEVHMLTTEAFNALLKTLEEPPAHALFMLCTTEQQKVPATIISRCVHIHFSPATIVELTRSLERIVTGEKIKITPDALSLIAKYGDGGFRDATKLLEEAVAFSAGKEITVEMIEEKLHIGGLEKSITEFLENLHKRDSNASLDFIEQMVKEKKDLNYFLQSLLVTLHDMFLEKFKIQNSELKTEPQNLNFTQEELQLLILLFGNAYKETKQAYLVQLPTEMAVVEWCDGQQVTSDKGPRSAEVSRVKQETRKADEIENIIPTIDVTARTDKQDNTIIKIKSDEGVTLPHLRKQVGAIAKIKALYGEKAVETAPSAPPIATTSVSLLNFSADGEITNEWLESFWSCIISEMKKHNHTLAGVLRSCKIKEFDRKSLTIEAAYQFHKDKIGDNKTLTILEGICKSLLGSPVSVTVTLRNKPINK